MKAPSPGRLSLAWLLGALLLVVIPAGRWVAESRVGLRIPSSPVDRTDGERGRQWLFLEACREHVPAGVPLSVVAPDSGVEMALFMMAIGVFPENVVVPRTYFRRPTPEEARRAEWILAFDTDAPPVEGAELVVRVDDGAIYRRRPAS